MHWRRKWQPTLVFLPGEFLGWGSLVGCRLWGHELILIPESEIFQAYTQSQKDFSDLIDKMFQYSIRDLPASQLNEVMEHFHSIFEILKPYETERSKSLQALWGNHHLTFEDIQKKNLDFKEFKRKYA